MLDCYQIQPEKSCQESQSKNSEQNKINPPIDQSSKVSSINFKILLNYKNQKLYCQLFLKSCLKHFGTIKATIFNRYILYIYYIYIYICYMFTNVGKTLLCREMLKYLGPKRNKLQNCCFSPPCPILPNMLISTHSRRWSFIFH